MLALSICFKSPATLLERRPQVCRVKITFVLLPNNWFVSTRINSMKFCVQQIRTYKPHTCLK